MAASVRHLLKPWTPSLCLMRWSRYNPYYLDPEPRKDAPVSDSELSPEQKELQELKTVRPIKAALTGDTSSAFSDPLISKFINMMMYDGNKVLARGIMTQTLETIKRKQVEKYHKSPAAKREEIECNPYAIFHQAMENCKPVIGLASIQKGGKFYQVPVPLTDNRRRFMAMKWMITECRTNKQGRTLMYEKLSQELLAAFANEGNVIKRKHDLHKMAEANRAYAHYRWW
ncbi:small ribosomal subunit protein uS7m [Danio rerio]|uniref:Small ribosomal subunit protein uS7m n=2 Tax=Danio rerio TaxID=7955 RepID=RT07_DANRE|nr:small ribosomal subunit protein uS7m precursor [Danio rerio]Q498Z6.1 RecName: Full=Small ribosomal subunit protein uS7m; AltName: Full=28S ribosomal protein S7, mitochondrial; Short=MRP-S7; Short=S7mt; Flags: Precursor [Danio rerio]AAI00014.1 Mitochondrial ribosomal protein S7 [Danio rerio]|eukprot:NP_001028768.1 28S ribosomal protein S7, mitochondrial precursor [Danio rerio]